MEELGSQHGLRQQDRDVMDMFTHAPPMTDAAHPSSLLLPPVLPSTALNLETLRPRLLSDAAQSVRLHVLLAVANILVDARELSAWSSGCKRQCTPLVEGVRSGRTPCHHN